LLAHLRRDFLRPFFLWAGAFSILGPHDAGATRSRAEAKLVDVAMNRVCIRWRLESWLGLLKHCLEAWESHAQCRARERVIVQRLAGAPDMANGRFGFIAVRKKRSPEV